MAARLRIDELGCDAKSISDLTNAALDNVVNIKFAADALRVCSLVPILERRIARQDPQFVPAGQLGDDVFGDAIAEILLSGLPLILMNGRTAIDGFPANGRASPAGDAPGERKPIFGQSAYARTGSWIFLRVFRPRSVKEVASFPAIASRTAADTTMPPGCAIPSSRAATLTAVPNRSPPLSTTSPR